MLDVNRRVMSAVARTSHDRACQPSFACSKRSAGLCDPSRGGVSVRSGARTSARPPSHASQRSYASASRSENCEICSRRSRGSLGQRERAAVGRGREVRTLRVDLVAVLLELELAQDRRRHEADHVGERGHLEVGTPRLLGDRRAADDVAPLEHDDARALLREQAGGHEAVVPASDHDDVERFEGASGSGHGREVTRRLTARARRRSDPASAAGVRGRFGTRRRA